MKHFWLKEKNTKFVPVNIKDLNSKKVPIVQIDKTLEKYAQKVLFQDKVDNANRMLKNIGLPKGIVIK